MPVDRSQMATASADIKAKAEALRSAVGVFCALSPNPLDYEGCMILRSSCEYNKPAIDQLLTAADDAALWLAAHTKE